jgi:transposase
MGLGGMEGTMRDLFWLSDTAWAVLEPHLPKHQPGARRVDDRRVISGILQILKTAGRWRDAPFQYGPAKITHNRYTRWARRGVWQRIFAKVAAAGPVPETLARDSTPVKAHRSASGGKGRVDARRWPSHVAAERRKSTVWPIVAAGSLP